MKVYLYALMLCYHPSPRMSLSAMAKDLDMQEEDVERAFKYWARDGLVRQVGDNPVRFTLANLKQLTLTRAENPGISCITKKVYPGGRAHPQTDASAGGDQPHQRLGAGVRAAGRGRADAAQIEMGKQRGRVSIKIADRRAKEWAQSASARWTTWRRSSSWAGARTAAPQAVGASGSAPRAPSEDEKTMYKTWIDEWGFTPEAVQEACRETTKGTPTMAYLNGILMRQHQLRAA